MKEKFPENKKPKAESPEGVDMAKVYSGIGESLMRENPEIARIFLREGGYSKEQIKRVEDATPQTEQPSEDPQKTVGFYKKLAEEFKKKGNDEIAEIYRKAVEKLEEKIDDKNKSEE